MNFTPLYDLAPTDVRTVKMQRAAEYSARLSASELDRLSTLADTCAYAAAIQTGHIIAKIKANTEDGKAWPGIHVAAPADKVLYLYEIEKENISMDPMQEDPKTYTLEFHAVIDARDEFNPVVEVWTLTPTPYGIECVSSKRVMADRGFALIVRRFIRELQKRGHVHI